MLSELSKNSLFSDTNKPGDSPQGSISFYQKAHTNVIKRLTAKEVRASSRARAPLSPEPDDRAIASQVREHRPPVIPILGKNRMTNPDIRPRDVGTTLLINMKKIAYYFSSVREKLKW
ncbi:MAG: hypothetical protein RLZZ338_191 [Cyanobacteriota bacterium]|jgi:hypothetical protein